MPTVFLNGEYMPLENAKISPLDRGFIFGDGVYEVIPYYDGRGLRAKERGAKPGFGRFWIKPNGKEGS